jgi:hypothetical protein
MATFEEIQKALLDSLATVPTEPNTEPIRSGIKTTVERILTQYPDAQSIDVTCDNTNNTEQMTTENRLAADIVFEHQGKQKKLLLETEATGMEPFIVDEDDDEIPTGN